MKKIVVIGEVLVEIMADRIGNGFADCQAFTGPYPSGAPAIFVDQAARVGQPCAIVSAVGDDDFGRVNLNRLRRDGVDTSAIRMDPDRPTGSAFVRYRSDGARDFIFNIRHSACGYLPDEATTTQALDSADHFHVMGSSLSSPALIALNLRAAATVKDRGGTVSFDPNLRQEFLGAPGVRDAISRILALTDVFLPSGEELMLLSKAETEREAVQELLAEGVSAVVHKNGSKGVAYYDAATTLSVPAFAVEEVDPTGAGDCFGGTFVALWLRGFDVTEALTLACAAGALAVTQRGPMEGTSTLDTLRRFVGANRKA